MKKFFIIIYTICFLLLCSCVQKNTSISSTIPPSDYDSTALSQMETDSSREASTSRNEATTIPEPESIFSDIQARSVGVWDSYTTDTVTYDFLQWLCELGYSDIFIELSDSLSQNSYQSDFWYDHTGRTLHVLKDWYEGKISSSQASFSNGKETLTLGFAGDLCLSEGWSTLNFYDAHNQNLSEGLTNGLIDKTNAFDIFTLNNEFTYSMRGAPLEGKYYTFRANPERIRIIQELGTDTVSLSNNHCYDFGADAFYDTLDTLTAAGIPYYGAGKNIEEAKRPVYFYINGIKIGFVGANRSEKYIMTPEAGTDSPGVLRTYDSAMYVETIQNAKAECDYLVAYVHWGTEDSTVVTDYQKEMGREYIDAGADAVIGGHPHVLQGMEYYKDKLIAYSLGDFWFNDLRDDTGLVSLEINADGLVKTQFIPCMRADGITSLVTDVSEASRIYSYMESLSFGIQIDSNGIVSSKKSTK